MPQMHQACTQSEILKLESIGTNASLPQCINCCLISIDKSMNCKQTIAREVTSYKPRLQDSSFKNAGSGK